MAINIGQAKIHSDAWRCRCGVAVRGACTAGRAGTMRGRPSKNLTADDPERARNDHDQVED
jgi:hypothetical protein